MLLLTMKNSSKGKQPPDAPLPSVHPVFADRESNHLAQWPPIVIYGYNDLAPAGDQGPPGCREDTPRETYDEALNRLRDMAYAEPLSKETLQKIGEGIADIRAGRCRSFDEVVREKGLE